MVGVSGSGYTTDLSSSGYAMMCGQSPVCSSPVRMFKTSYVVHSLRSWTSMYGNSLQISLTGRTRDASQTSLALTLAL